MGQNTEIVGRRNFLRMIAVGSAATAFGGIFSSQTTRGAAAAENVQDTRSTSADHTTETETAAYHEKLTEAVAARIEAARADITQIHESSPYTFKELLSPIQHWEEVTQFLVYFADTYMIKHTATDAAPIDQIEAETAHLASEYVTKVALIVDRVLTKFQDALGMTTSGETGYSSHDWDAHLSPLRRLILLLLDMHNGRAPQIENDHIFTITRDKTGRVLKKIDTGDTFKERVGKVLGYVLTLPLDLLVSYVREIDSPEDLANPTYVPRLKISEDKTFDTDGLIGYINENVFDPEALEKYTQPTKDSIRLSTRIVSFFLGRRSLDQQALAEKRLRIAEQVEEDLSKISI